jgi:hypothetical protein
VHQEIFRRLWNALETPLFQQAIPSLVELMFCLGEYSMVSWKWLAGLGTPLGIIAAPIADSLIKEGKFPDGLGAVLSKLGSWLTSFWGWFFVEEGVPHWLLLVFFLAACACLFAIWCLIKNSNEPAQASIPSHDPGFAPLSSAHVLLETSYAALKQTNADLQRQLEVMSQAGKEAEVEIPAFAIKTLNTIVNLTNRGFKPNMIFLNTSLGSRVEVEGAIDILLERKMLQYTDTAGTTSYSLTPKGRAYYLEQKSKQAG